MQARKIYENSNECVDTIFPIFFFFYHLLFSTFSILFIPATKLHHSNQKKLQVILTVLTMKLIN